MGLRFKKSVSFGPFRATLSKSGISFSAGIKGARITKKANGNVMSTIGIPGTGIYYTKETSMKNKQYKIIKEKNLSQKEIEQMTLNQISQEPKEFYDLIPFSDIKERTLFIIGYYAGLFNNYKEGEIAELTLENLAIPFKTVDMNNIAAKIGEKRDYTSNHLSKMVDKGWFIREGRGIYKINIETIYPYIEEFKEYQKQIERKKLVRELEQITQQKIEKEKLEQETKQKEQNIAKQEELKKEKKKQYLYKIKKLIAITTIFFGGGCFGIPQFLCGRTKLGIFSIILTLILVNKNVDFGFGPAIPMLIIPIISIIWPKTKE